MTDNEARLKKIIEDLRIQNADLRHTLGAIADMPHISDQAMEAEYGKAGWAEIQRLRSIATNALRTDGYLPGE